VPLICISQPGTSSLWVIEALDSAVDATVQMIVAAHIPGTYQQPPAPPPAPPAPMNISLIDGGLI
jgi:hypothetical protein